MYLANFWFVQHDVWSPLKHTWSLCVEEHFYLLWPLLLTLLPPRIIDSTTSIRSRMETGASVA